VAVADLPAAAYSLFRLSDYSSCRTQLHIEQQCSAAVWTVPDAASACVAVGSIPSFDPFRNIVPAVRG
jgi:hypothetical protein